MKLKALDSFYSDETKMVTGGQAFEVESAALGQDLIKRGVAQEIKVTGDKDKGSAPANKDTGAAPSNKAAK